MEADAAPFTPLPLSVLRFTGIQSYGYTDQRKVDTDVEVTEIVNSNLMCLRKHPSQRLMIKCLAIPDRIGIWKHWFLRRGENRGTRRKTSRNKEEDQQQTRPTYDSGSGNRTRDTLVGGERSHHCAIPVLFWKT